MVLPPGLVLSPCYGGTASTLLSPLSSQVQGVPKAPSSAVSCLWLLGIGYSHLLNGHILWGVPLAPKNQLVCRWSLQLSCIPAYLLLL